MKDIVLGPYAGFEDWREPARRCLAEGHAPDQVVWQSDKDAPKDLFLQSHDAFLKPPADVLKNFLVPREFLDSAALALCHQSPGRFALAYRILWRLCHENKNLLRYKTDQDVLKLQSHVKAVRRDAYKIKAFLRFREAADCRECFIAWYEPEHYTLDLSLPFFQTRFKNMTWAILTPYRAAYWDRKTISFSDNPNPALYPKNDEVEAYWLKYYASTFNPARPKKAAMLNQMPKKYWKNMPETVLIPDLLQRSEARAKQMIDRAASK